MNPFSIQQAIVIEDNDHADMERDSPRLALMYSSTMVLARMQGQEPSKPVTLQVPFAGRSV